MPNMPMMQYNVSIMYILCHLHHIPNGLLCRVPRSTFSFSAEKGGKIYCIKNSF